MLKQLKLSFFVSRESQGARVEMGEMDKEGNRQVKYPNSGLQQVPTKSKSDDHS